MIRLDSWAQAWRVEGSIHEERVFPELCNPPHKILITMLLSRKIGLFPAALSSKTFLWSNRLIGTRCRLQSTSSSNEPLRILFCGSDHFSATSLKALYAEYSTRRGAIESIDVLCRQDQRSGRGLRTLKEGMRHPIITPLHFRKFQPQ